MIESIIPKDREDWLRLREPNINSTEVAALFELSPYLTKFELWHRKKNKIVSDFEPTERMRWGNRLEAAIAAGVAEDHELEIRKMSEYMFDPALRLGSSFDYAYKVWDKISGVSIGNGILEVKNVDSLAYKDGWIIGEGVAEAPPFIEIQHQTQLLISGYVQGIIAPLVGGNRTPIIMRQPDLKIHESIKARVAEFWYSIDHNIEPKPDFTKDASFIISLQQYAEPGKVMDASGDHKIAGLVKEYKHWGEKEDVAKKQRQGVKAELMNLIGDAERVVGEWGSISAGLIGETLVEAFTRKAYRTFRINHKKEKPA